jgi:hypothetical protein
MDSQGEDALLYSKKNLDLHNRAIMYTVYMYEGRSESKERFAVQRDLLILGKQNMQVLSHTLTYFST